MLGGCDCCDLTSRDLISAVGTSTVLDEDDDEGAVDLGTKTAAPAAAREKPLPAAAEARLARSGAGLEGVLPSGRKMGIAAERGTLRELLLPALLLFAVAGSGIGVCCAAGVNDCQGEG